MSARSVILNSNNWEEFNQNLVKLDKREKGDAFELLTKYLFKVVPTYSDIYDEVWIHHELPQKLKKKFNYRTYKDQWKGWDDFLGKDKN